MRFVPLLVPLVVAYKSFYFQSGIIEDWMTPVGSVCCCFSCVALEVPAKINGSLSHPHSGKKYNSKKKEKKPKQRHHHDRCVRFNASGLCERNKERACLVWKDLTVDSGSLRLTNKGDFIGGFLPQQDKLMAED